MLTPFDPDELQTRHNDRSCDLNALGFVVFSLVFGSGIVAVKLILDQYK